MGYVSQETRYPHGGWGGRYPPQNRAREGWRNQQEDDAAFAQWAKALTAREPGRSLEDRFENLVDVWHEETDLHSSLVKVVSHPAYLNIVAMGQKAVPLILREMRRRPGHWLPAIQALATAGDLLAEGENPAAGSSTSSQARAAWVKWGESKGYL